MKVELAVLADAANMTDSGKLNMLGVFQTIHALTVPCFIPQIYVVILLRAELGEEGIEHRVHVQLRDSELKEMSASPEVRFIIDEKTPTPGPEVPIFLGMSNFMFPEFGDYELHVMVNGTIQCAINLLVQPLTYPASEETA